MDLIAKQQNATRMGILVCLLVGLSLVAGATASVVLAAESCDAAGLSQAELNECYANAYNEADVEHNVLYRQITASLKDDKATTELLVAAQRAWVVFRDAECAFSASGASGGTAHGMIPAICLDKLTGKRIDDFKDYLKCQEGALDCPIPAK